MIGILDYFPHNEVLRSRHYRNALIAFAILSMICANAQVGLVAQAAAPGGQIVQSNYYYASLYIYAFGYALFLVSLIFGMATQRFFIYGTIIAWVIVVSVWAASLASNMNNEQNMHNINMANVAFIVTALVYNCLAVPFLIY
jgi:hypothetical protein